MPFLPTASEQYARAREQLGSVTSRLPGFEESPLYLGGDVGEGVQVLHGVPELTGSRRVLDGLFMGIDPWHARELLDAGARSPRDFRFFFRWLPRPRAVPSPAGSGPPLPGGGRPAAERHLSHRRRRDRQRCMRFSAARA